MKRLLLLASLALLGLTPAQKRVVLSGFSDSQCDNLIQSAGPTMSLDVPNAEIERAPIVHFLLEDNAVSTAVVNKANAALAGTASANTNTFCNTAAKISKGCTFAVASSHLIDMGSDVIGTGEDSVCMWINPTTIATAQVQMLAYNAKLVYYINNVDGKLRLTSNNSTVLTSTGVIGAGAFTHLCFTRTAAGAATFYINGVADSSSGATGAPEAGTTNLFLANRNDGARTFGGILDDIRIYDYALSPAQIATIYNNGTGHQKLATREKANIVTVVGATPAVSSILDRQGIEFAQSTAASQPSLTGIDGRENRLTNSGDLSQSTWNKAGYPVSVSGTTVTATATTNGHYAYQALLPLVAGEIYRISVELGYNNHQFASIGTWGDAAYHWQVVDLSNGTLGTSTNCASTITTVSAGRYRVDMVYTNASAHSNGQLHIGFATASNNAAITSWTPAGTEKFEFYTAQFSSSLADPTYIATTTYPIYRGLNGRRAVRFDGAGDLMTSTATWGDLFGASAKTQFLVFRAGDGTARYLFRELTAGGQTIVNATPAVSSTNNDGGADTIRTGTIAANVPYVYSLRHDGSNLYSSLNGGEQVPVASGATATMTGTVTLSSSTSSWLGEIATLLTFAKVLPSDTRAKINKCLCRKAGASC